MRERARQCVFGCARLVVALPSWPPVHLHCPLPTPPVCPLPTPHCLPPAVQRLQQPRPSGTQPATAASYHSTPSRRAKTPPRRAAPASCRSSRAAAKGRARRAGRAPCWTPPGALPARRGARTRTLRWVVLRCAVLRSTCLLHQPSDGHIQQGRAPAEATSRPPPLHPPRRCIPRPQPPTATVTREPGKWTITLKPKGLPASLAKQLFCEPAVASAVPRGPCLPDPAVRLQASCPPPAYPSILCGLPNPPGQPARLPGLRCRRPPPRPASHLQASTFCCLLRERVNQPQGVNYP